VIKPVAAVRDAGGAVVVNALRRLGGPTLAALDGGIAWAEDSAGTPSGFHNTGNNTYASSGGTLDGSVPASTPAAIFDSERFDPPTGDEMAWDFPLGDSGGTVEVRLYFMSSFSGTSNPGDRAFDVQNESVTVLTNYDMVADVGHNVGVMKSFLVASDAVLDIDFIHVTENPLVNAIEILGDPAVADERNSWGDVKSLFR
jgi:hypothetical protein